MEYNVQTYPYRNRESMIRKRILHWIIENCSLECIEKHNDEKAKDILYTNISNVNNEERRVFYAEAFIPSIVYAKKYAKDVDATIIIINDASLNIDYKAIDLKRNLITYSDSKNIEDNLNTTFDTISHLIEQWQDAHKYSKFLEIIYDRHSINFFPIVITRNYSRSVLTKMLKEANEGLREKSISGILGIKKDVKDIFYKEKIYLLEKFCNSTVILNEEELQIEVLLFSKSPSNDYTYTMNID